MRAVNSFKYLFTSGIRLSLIQEIFYFPGEMHYVRELTRLIKTEINAVRRELANLVKSGLVVSESRSNKIYYQANYSSPLFQDMVTLAHKTHGLGGDIHKSLNKLGKINLVFYSRNFLTNEARGDNYDKVDIIIVGQVILPELSELIKKEEVLRGYEVNYMVMEQSELNIRRQRRDPFIIDFYINYPVVICGEYAKIT